MTILQVGRQPLRTVAALYIDDRGPYPKLEGVDCWDQARDARLYDGPSPIVAHPPCGPWSSLRHQYKGAEQDVGIRAVEQVRRWGGVLEQPAGSRLFEYCGLPRTSVDSDDSYSLEVEQVAWGHPARKRTWLWLVRIPRAFAVRGIRTGGTITHWCSGGGTGRGKTPPGIKVCSAQQRRRTPVLFAEWLVSLARSVTP